MDKKCPNCGHSLLDYRKDRQSAGMRDVILRWAVCANCRHVALVSWDFAEEAIPSDRRRRIG